MARAPGRTRDNICLVILSTEDFAPDAPEGASRSEYINRKDLKWIIIILVALGVVLAPVYLTMRAQQQKQACAANLGQIYKGLFLYSQLNDDRLPPVYEMEANGTPRVQDVGGKGAVISWASHLGSHIPDRVRMSCPASTADENVPTLVYGRPGKDDAIEPVSYGMVVSLSSMPLNDLADQNGTLLITETANNGAQGSYNPQPFRLDGKVVPYDGLAIGWNTSNSFPTPQTEWMTRLAFRNTSQGNFGGQTLGRHNLVNNAIMADGSLRHISAPDAKVKIQRGRPSGIWNVEATFYPLYYEEGATEAAPNP